MAEQEIAKHTKAVYKAWNNPQTSWKQKLKEILVEVLIIVFAVSLSIWLHNWSEKNHDRSDAEEFLNGLQADLKSDIEEMKQDRESYIRVVNGSPYLLKLSYGDTLKKDSLTYYLDIFYNTTFLNPNTSRFEALKASGKIGIIENKKLLGNILAFYQEDIPYLNMLNQQLNTYKMGRLAELLDKNLTIDKNGNGNWLQVLRLPEIQNSLRRFENAKEALTLYTKTIARANKIIAEINTELDE